jgi:tripartite-type tricarboxylate transporter receptor subunit TctC
MKSGKLVALAVTGSVRSNLAPEVPTFKEAGVSGVDVNLWFALFAPAGTPATIVTRLNEALNAALRAPAVAARLQALAFDPEGGTAAQLADAMRKEAPLYARIVREAGIKAD